jgi:hypothetical protein
MKNDVFWVVTPCGRVYIAQTSRSVDIRIKEHQRHIRLYHPDKSAVAEHSIDQGHRIHGVTTQKTPFFIVTAVKTSNLTRVT